MVIGRVCGKPELGVYTLVWTLLSLGTEISAALITTPYTVFSPHLNRYRRSRYLGSIFVHQVVLAIFFALVIVTGSCLSSWYGWSPRNFANVFTTTAGVTVFVCIKEFVRRVSFAELNIRTVLFVDGLASATQIGGVLFLFRLGALSVSGTLAVLGISSAVAVGIWFRLGRDAFRFEPLLYKRDLRRNWRFAKWSLASGVLSSVSRYLFPWMLAAFHGTSVTGSWAACSAIVAMCNPAVIGISNYALPRISNVYASSGTAAMRKTVNRFSLLFVLLLLPVVLLLGACGERLITGVYGMAYSGSALVLFLLGLNLLINTLTNPFSQGLFSLDCAKADTLINALCVALLFTVGIDAVRLYAATGAATALLVSSAITAAVRIGVFQRKADQAFARTVNLIHDARRVNGKDGDLNLATFAPTRKMARS
jgi:O-antigen/teichoic acid export membrane protein